MCLWNRCILLSDIAMFVYYESSVSDDSRVGLVFRGALPHCMLLGYVLFLPRSNSFNYVPCLLYTNQTEYLIIFKKMRIQLVLLMSIQVLGQEMLL